MDRIRLVRDHGVEADAHFGTTVQHLHLVKKGSDEAKPSTGAPDRAREDSRMERARSPCPMRLASENITTSGLDLEYLPAGTKMRFSSGAEILLTGLRKPCHQVDKFSAETLRLAVSDTKDARCPLQDWVMGVVLAAGEILKGEGIKVVLPPEPHQFMEKSRS